MNIARSYNYAVAILMILIYLILPVGSFAGSASPGVVSQSTIQSHDTVSSPSPCDTCPCSDRHGSDCCDSTCFSCACHAPLGQGLQLAYSPVVASLSFQEPHWSLPQVYRTIIVPPQNLS